MVSGSLDPYSILEIDHSATSNDIRNAYVGMCKRHHPDKSGNDATFFNSIEAAYNVLSNTATRELYDQDNTIPMERLKQALSLTQENPSVDMLRHTIYRLDKSDQRKYWIDNVGISQNITFGNDWPMSPSYVTTNTNVNLKLTDNLAYYGGALTHLQLSGFSAYRILSGVSYRICETISIGTQVELMGTSVSHQISCSYIPDPKTSANMIFKNAPTYTEYKIDVDHDLTNNTKMRLGCTNGTSNRVMFSLSHKFPIFDDFILGLKPDLNFDNSTDISFGTRVALKHASGYSLSITPSASLGGDYGLRLSYKNTYMADKATLFPIISQISFEVDGDGGVVILHISRAGYSFSLPIAGINNVALGFFIWGGLGYFFHCVSNKIAFYC